MRYLYIGTIAGICAIIITVILSSSKDTLEVDAFRDQSDIAGFYRVILKNNSDKDIDNIVINFGTHNITLAKLPAKQSMMVSPTGDIIYDRIIVTADPNIYIEKEFRSAPKMPGMIGGMG